MDARMTGHAYHFLQQAAAFAKRQPRKYLWERNSYFYAPAAHGSWQDFMNMVGSSLKGKYTIWGPVAATDGLEIDPLGPKPPVADPSQDSYQWGVGEEADLITFLPIFDVRKTKWVYPDKLWGVSRDLPRRTSPIAQWRLSRKLLNVMHRHTTDGAAVVSEMSGPTWAMLHGLKAVHVPQPIWIDGQWSAKELMSVVNPGEPDAVNGGADSFFNWDHKLDHIMYRLSYMFITQAAEDLYRRWLGYPPDMSQRTDEKIETFKDPKGRYFYDEGVLNEERYGHLCFPPMWIHTIKNTAREKGPDRPVPVDDWFDETPAEVKNFED
ncbi:hypothetical protein JX266_009139 [Neoarthrinium moseri]|nr:hypothetical protein JX266_009139 [Neoarthrinium moseri]